MSKKIRLITRLASGSSSPHARIALAMLSLDDQKATLSGRI